MFDRKNTGVTEEVGESWDVGDGIGRGGCFVTTLI